MNRDRLMEQIADSAKIWDMVIIGGGATGLGIALDAAARGYSAALFEQDDFAKSTSSRSTKLVHGGVRYLQKGDVALVREALRERGRMKRNAPHLVKDQTFIISNYSWFDNILYMCGLTMYDILSRGRGLSFGRSRFISPKRVAQLLPCIKKEGLKGGVVYHDGQFDDSRMAVNLAQSCVDHGAATINHIPVTAILHNARGEVCGVRVRDEETGKQYEVMARAVINAAGVHVDAIMEMDSPDHTRAVTPSQGVHLVLDNKFLRSDHAIMIPRTSDGRVLFAVPWHDKVVVGTTDIVRDTPEIEPAPSDEEVDFILSTAGLYMDPAPTRADILSVFAGQRPLAASGSEGKSTKEISRSHKIILSRNGLITVTGGKWTSYRLMAEKTVDKAIAAKMLPLRKCVTRELKIHGWRPNPDLADHLYIYGSDIDAIRRLWQSDPSMREKLHPDHGYTVAEVVWAVREEMALNVEDVLARRVRLLFVDALAAIEAAPTVSKIVAEELGKDAEWERARCDEFVALARRYIPLSTKQA